MEQARELLEATVSDHPTDLTIRRELGKCNDQIGVMLQQLGRSAEAVPAHRRACEVYRRLIQAEPKVPLWRRLLGHGLGNLAIAYGFGGHKSEALAAYVESREQVEALLLIEPTNLGYRGDLAMTLNNMSMLMDAGDAQIAVFREGLSLREAIAAEMPGDAYAKRNAARTRFNLAITLGKLGRLDESLREFDAAVLALREVYAPNPADVSHGRELAAALHERAKTLQGLRRFEEATASVSEAIKLYGDAQVIDPQNALYREFLTDAYYVSADVFMELGQRDKALSAWQAVLPICEEIAQSRPDDPAVLAEVTKVRKKIAELLVPSGP